MLVLIHQLKITVIILELAVLIDVLLGMFYFDMFYLVCFTWYVYLICVLLN